MSKRRRNRKAFSRDELAVVPQQSRKQKMNRAYRSDTWVSTVGGLGGATDKSVGIEFQPREPLLDPELDALYTDMWLARRVVNKLPAIAMVRGFKILDMEETEKKELVRQFNALNTKRYRSGAFQRWVKFGRLYGGCALILGYSDRGAYHTPAPTDGTLEYIDVVPRHQLHAMERYNDINHPDVRMPVWYKIHGDHPRHGMVIHESRILRSTGLDAPETFLAEQHEPEWSMSVLQPVIEDLQRYGTSWQAVSHLLQEASVGVLKMAGLIDAIASEDQSEIEDRIDILNTSKGVTNLLMLDADMNESFERVRVAFSDLPQLMQQLMIATAGAAEMPVTVLFGQAPSGLNATGESDMRQFYDTVTEYQQRDLKPALELILSHIANKPVEIAFPDIWEPTEKDKSLARQADAGALSALFSAGVFEPEEIAAALAMGKKPEEIIDAAERLKDLKERKEREKREGIENSAPGQKEEDQDGFEGT